MCINGEGDSYVVGDYDGYNPIPVNDAGLMTIINQFLPLPVTPAREAAYNLYCTNHDCWIGLNDQAADTSWITESYGEKHRRVCCVRALEAFTRDCAVLPAGRLVGYAAVTAACTQPAHGC